MGGMRYLLLLCVLSVCGFGQSAETEVPGLVREFLAHVGDPAMHDRFWADDLMYTSAGGVFRTKAQILASMKGQSAGSAAPSKDAAESYSAEDMTVHDFGTMAVAAFRLVRHAAGKDESFRNTGTFLFRNGKWQVVGWQATRIAEKTE